jgi:Ca2+:H+ antiporter
VGRRLLWASLALAPATAALDWLGNPSEVTLFVLSAISLIPLAWLIGESTEHAAEHTGPGIGGFLNASFGNAPELIIALFAIGDNLPEVVRGSLAGSVVSNLLLVFGITQIVGPDGVRIDRRSLLVQVGLVGVAVVALLPPVVLGYTGDPDRHEVVVASIPVAIVLLVVYVAVVGRNLQRHSRREQDAPAENAWPMWRALVALAAATIATAYVSELLVHSLTGFAHAVGLSEFFISVVIVAIVGNASEHGGAVVIARNGNMRLASEIAISSSAQVALFVLPVVMLLSLLFANPLTLAFRWVELGAMAVSAALVAGTLFDGRSHRREGAMLTAAYAVAVVVFYIAGNR